MAGRRVARQQGAGGRFGYEVLVTAAVAGPECGATFCFCWCSASPQEATSLFCAEANTCVGAKN